MVFCVKYSKIVKLANFVKSINLLIWFHSNNMIKKDGSNRNNYEIDRIRAIRES